ncbi:hypothetical protein [Streptomyces tropicalis]|uniref:Uncharacterized protein n=1 Tax=Streptomyces tropicalis TaxID=3034234 RepID=A0ABT6A7Y0_9ACTN|nr:hypothetical protein [Streptomyces tropicalis]MDF3300547.1 hypothetical protein [Streptomyces tropicalis]
MPAVAGRDHTWREWLETPVRWAGAATGLAVNALVPFDSESDVDLLYEFAAFGLCVMLGALAADVVAHRRPGRLRVASTTPRRIRDFVPHGLTAGVAGQAVVLVALLVVAVSTASPDDAGHSGRALSVTCPEGDQLLSPWPGPYYAWPILGGLMLGTAACALILRRITARSGSDDQRHAGARAAIGAWGVVVCAPLFAVSVNMGVVVLSLACAGGMKIAVLWGLVIAALISAVTAGHCLCVALLPQVYLKARP